MIFPVLSCSIPNVAVHPAEGRRGAPLPRIGCNGLCTPDMGMSLWGESPLWEDPMSSG